uniref:(northern house mosquito) hypothetical protein n=1 Tax=Culex pipiens TaxID=7175 RepID=A0A8D8GL05_CULPI
MWVGSKYLFKLQPPKAAHHVRPAEVPGGIREAGGQRSPAAGIKQPAVHPFQLQHVSSGAVESPPRSQRRTQLDCLWPKVTPQESCHNQRYRHLDALYRSANAQPASTAVSVGLAAHQLSEHQVDDGPPGLERGQTAQHRHQAVVLGLR